VQKIVTFGGHLTNLWQKQFCTVFWDTMYKHGYNNTGRTN